MRLRVASYNIHRAIGRDGRYEPGRILRVAKMPMIAITVSNSIQGEAEVGSVFEFSLHDAILIVDVILQYQQESCSSCDGLEKRVRTFLT